MSFRGISDVIMTVCLPMTSWLYSPTHLHPAMFYKPEVVSAARGVGDVAEHDHWVADVGEDLR